MDLLPSAKVDANSQRTCDKCQKTFGSLGGWIYHTSNNVCDSRAPEPSAVEATAVERDASLKEAKDKDIPSASRKGKLAAKAAAAGDGATAVEEVRGMAAWYFLLIRGAGGRGQSGM